MKLFVEGGGDDNDLRTECRRGFTEFLKKAGVTKKPRISACGGRESAFDSYCTAIRNGEAALLLVDSEGPIAAKHQQGDEDQWQPWAHLKERPGDHWEMPQGGADEHCHLMVQVMESWFLADRKTLSDFFGQGFRQNKLPPEGTPIEDVAKEAVYSALETATKTCKTKAPYGKGPHSFKILAKIEPKKILERSPWARRLIAGLEGSFLDAGASLQQGSVEPQAQLSPAALSESQQAVVHQAEEARSAKDLRARIEDELHLHTFRSQVLESLIEDGLLAMTLPDKPKSPKQQYKLTARGLELKKSLERAAESNTPDTDATP